MTVVPAAAIARDDLGGRAVGQGEEDARRRRRAAGRVDREAGRGEMRVGLADRLVVAAAALEPDDLDGRVAARSRTSSAPT